jgi:polysaccharide pyruvyl transferase WcaK-like protein
MSGLEKRSSCSTTISTGSGLQTQQTHQMQTLMNKVDGVAVCFCLLYKKRNKNKFQSVLNSMGETERILLQGQLNLLDSETMQPKHAIYAVLLSNSLLIGHPSVVSGAGVGPTKHLFHLVSFFLQLLYYPKKTNSF